MQLSTKRYGGDAMRTYKALMRKLNREGYYQEIKEKEFFKIKSEKRRESDTIGRIRTKKKLKLIEETLAKELPIKKHKNTRKQKN
jgi:ribosomal protein S21